MHFRSKTAIQNEITIKCLNSNFNSKPQKFNEFCIQNFGTFFNLSFLTLLSNKIKTISALITMNFIKIKRNPSFVFLMIVLPILEISVFCNTVGLEPKNLDLGVINEENCTLNPT